jgi:PAS domain S-box-containing protein
VSGQEPGNVDSISTRHSVLQEPCILEHSSRPRNNRLLPASLILVVDDNAPLRYALGRTLKQNGFEIVEAATGEEAIYLSQSKHPDLVLLDVNLPDIHGFEVARRLKADDTTRHIPILEISASFVQMEHRMEGLAAGADAYLVEPVEPGELVANIRALLRMRDAEQSLRHTSAMLSAVVESSPLAIAVFDRDGVVRTWNPAAERLFGWPRSEMVGRPVLGGSGGPLPDEALMAGLRSGEAAHALERRYARRDGVPVDVSVFAAPLDRGAAQGYLTIFEDISGRKLFERERAEILAREREARREAEAANRLKDEFLATLSHELRTPLNAVMGWMSMLRHNTLDAPGRDRAMEVIERNLRSQQQLISDILEVSQIIRGRLRLEMNPVDVVQAVTAAVESVGPTAHAKHQVLDARLPASPVLVAGDSSRLQQVFWNLLSNAVKYTPRAGRIEVSVDGSNADVDITIRDSGIGIAPQVLPHIFERFRQGESGPTREFGGLGLGLAIVRHLVEMHGGAVRAASEGTGRGAAFTVTLPRAS